MKTRIYSLEHKGLRIGQRMGNGPKNMVVSVKIRYYNCGVKTHQLRECPDLDKGPKCFPCR